MPRRPIIEGLPVPLRSELDRRLVANRFGDYVALAQWLREQGYRVGKTAVWRYGQRLSQKLKAARGPVNACDVIGANDTAKARREARRMRAATGVFVLIIDPPTQRTWSYGSAHGLRGTQERVEEALFGRVISDNETGGG